MTDRAIQDCLQAIGQAIVDQIDGDHDGAFLYAEVEPGMLYEALFVETADGVELVDASDVLCKALFDAWYASEPDKAWATLSFAIVGDSFDARFQYPDEISDEEGPEDRRRRILKARYGDKPIKYPPPPSDAMEL